MSTWASFDRSDKRSGSYGGFVGYNTQWDDAIIGVEVNYSHTSVSGSSSDFQCYSSSGSPGCLGAITLGNNFAYDANVTATATARITDYGTFRARGGWAVGNFMPYAIAGIAVARAEVTRTANATFFVVNPASPVVPPHSESDIQTRFTWGYSLGLGVDFLVMPNVFVRGEYEYIGFEIPWATSSSTSTPRASAPASSSDRAPFGVPAIDTSGIVRRSA